MFWRKVKEDMELEGDRSGQRRSLRKGDTEQRAEGAAITSYVDNWEMEYFLGWWGQQVQKP